METARLTKRVWAYVINLVMNLATGFACGIPFLTLLKWHYAFYILISLGIAIVFSFINDTLIMKLTKGYTVGSVIFGIKYVASDGQRLNGKQIIIRSASESILIFVLFDLIYFLKNRTERGVIDRLSDSFAIDTRI